MAEYDDGAYYEVQLNNKQLVFFFMAALAIAVVVFLCGVMVGRGVRDATLAAAQTDIAPSTTPRTASTPRATTAAARPDSTTRPASKARKCRSVSRRCNRPAPKMPSRLRRGLRAPRRRRPRRNPLRRNRLRRPRPREGRRRSGPIAERSRFKSSLSRQRMPRSRSSPGSRARTTAPTSRREPTPVSTGFGSAVSRRERKRRVSRRSCATRKSSAPISPSK